MPKLPNAAQCSVLAQDQSLRSSGAPEAVNHDMYAMPKLPNAAQVSVLAQDLSHPSQGDADSRNLNDRIWIALELPKKDEIGNSSRKLEARSSDRKDEPAEPRKVSSRTPSPPNVSSRLPAQKEEISLWSEVAAKNGPIVRNGDMARDLRLLQQDLLESHQRVLSILEPHVQGATHIESEISLLRVENQRLTEQLKCMNVVPDTGVVPNVDYVPPKSSVLSAFNPARISTISEANPLASMETSIGYSSAAPGSTQLQERPSHGVASGQSVSFSALASGISHKTVYSSLAKTPELARGMSKAWDILTKPTADRRVTALRRQIDEEEREQSRQGDQGPQAYRSSAMSERRTQRQTERTTMRVTHLGSAAESEFEPRKSGWRTRLQDMISSNGFEMLFGLIIVSNSVFIGLEVDYVAGHPIEEVPDAYTFMGYIYTAVFTAELLLRLVADCYGFLCTSFNQMLWNYLDILIVASSIAEVALDIVKAQSTAEDSADDGEGGGVNLSNLKIIRIIRITKLMRLFRIARIVKFVRALRTLIVSIVSTLKAVFWSLLLLTVIIYCFAIMFTQAASDYTVEVNLGVREASLDEKEEFRLIFFWGSLAESMLALFMSISGGVSWVDVLNPLRKVDPMWMYTFLAYIGFVYFAVLNVVTGVFCQAAIESQQNDQESMVQVFLSNKALYTERFVKLFKAMDNDCSGEVTREEFENNMENPKVEAYFATLGIDPTDARGLFRLLEGDEDVGLDIEEFVHGCLRLKGQARSADLARLMHEHKAMYREVHNMHNFVKERLGMGGKDDRGITSQGFKPVGSQQRPR